MNIFGELYEGNLNSGPMDYSYICLIPKKERALAASDFRPISLINGVQKIIFKVLANRLGSVMERIISSSQAAFLKNRSILNSFVTASEILSWSHKTGDNSIGIKADFGNDYDRVNWDFLKMALTWLERGPDIVWLD